MKVYESILDNKETSMGQLKLKTAVFKEGEYIPERFTCDGDDINPLIEIRGAPEGTKSLAIVVDDPDASSGGVWDHWVLWNIDQKTQYIHENAIPAGVVVGTTRWDKNVYGGPCPPKGDKAHRYRFKLYALDTLLNLPETAHKAELEQAMKGHIIEQTMLTGLYGRK